MDPFSLAIVSAGLVTALLRCLPKQQQRAAPASDTNPESQLAVLEVLAIVAVADRSVTSVEWDALRNAAARLDGNDELVSELVHRVRGLEPELASPERFASHVRRLGTRMTTRDRHRTIDLAYELADVGARLLGEERDRPSRLGSIVEETLASEPSPHEHAGATRGLEPLWQAFVAYFVARGLPAPESPRATLGLGGVRVEVVLEDRWTRGPIVAAHGSYLLGAGPAFHAREEGLLAATASLVGASVGQDLGDPAFDEAMTVRTRHAEETAVAWTPKAREHALAIPRARVLRSDGVSLEARVSVVDPAEVAASLDAMVGAVAELSRYRAKDLDALATLPGAELVAVREPPSRAVEIARSYGAVRLAVPPGLSRGVLVAELAPPDGQVLPGDTRVLGPVSDLPPDLARFAAAIAAVGEATLSRADGVLRVAWPTWPSYAAVIAAASLLDALAEPAPAVGAYR